MPLKFAPLNFRANSALLGMFLFFLLSSVQIFAQVPTNQDCKGAISVCQNVYTQNNSFTGTGNYPNEVNGPISCLGGEVNSVWYTITIQTSGDLAFTLTPNGTNDDYDWAVFNLTNASCADIFTNVALEVSCNFFGLPGPTGPNGGASPLSEPVIPVLAGETYAIIISNFSTTQSGYNLNFSSSTAQIFDNIPPRIDSVYLPVACGATTLTFRFSENVLCNTVQAGDFALNGPGGPYTINAVSSSSCVQGAQYDNLFTVTLSTPITTSGTYSLVLVDDVTDLCGNLGLLNVGADFSVTALDLTTSIVQTGCLQFDATVNVVGAANPPYTYNWSTIPPQNTSTVVNLGPGSYTVTVSDQGGCVGVANVDIIVNPTLAIQTSFSPADCGFSNANMGVDVTIGTGPFNFSWNPAVAGNTDTVTGVPSGVYAVTVTDPTGCSVTQNIVVTDIPLGFSLSSDTVVCSGQPVTLSCQVFGGAPPFSYNWSGGLPNSSSNTFVPPGSQTYTVQATDVNGCTTAQLSVNVDINSPLNVNLSGTPLVCPGQPALLTALGSGGDGNFTFTWDQGIGTDSSNITVNPADTTIYTVTITDGCGSPSVQASFTVNVAPVPLVDFFADQVSGCTPFSVRFFPQIIANQGSFLLWEFGEITSNDSLPSVRFFTGGCVDVSLIVQDGLTGCQSKMEKPCYLEVFQSPKADFSMNPTAINLFEGSSVVLTEKSEGWQNLSWNISDGSQYSGPTVEHNFSDTGSYRILLTAFGDNNCFDTLSRTIYVFDLTTFYLPNSFTPNADTKNDVFLPGVSNLQAQSYQMIIFDRWGKEVFRSSEPEMGWTGEGFPQGVYPYRIRFRDREGNPKQVFGSVTLIR